MIVIGVSIAIVILGLGHFMLLKKLAKKERELTKRTEVAQRELYKSCITH